jgi:hypothetical protein
VLHEARLLMRLPFFFSTKEKVDLFYALVEKDQESFELSFGYFIFIFAIRFRFCMSVRYYCILRMFLYKMAFPYFMIYTSPLSQSRIDPADAIPVTIRRDNLVNDSYQKLMPIKHKLRQNIRIVFVNSEGLEVCRSILFYFCFIYLFSF